MPSAESCCCGVCGSPNVEYAIWFNPNTLERGEPFGSWNAGDNTFCADCDVEGRNPNPPLIDAGAEPKEYGRARSKWLRKCATERSKPARARRSRA